MTSRETRIFYDISATIESGLSTGIQKVVMQLAENMSQISPGYDFEFIPVLFDSKQNQIYKFDLAGHRKSRRSQESESSQQDSLMDGITVLLRRFYYAASFVPGVKSARKIIQKKKSRYSFEIEPFISKDPIVLRKSDVIVIADAFWNVEGWANFLVDPFKCPSRLILFVHDVIPISNPEFFEIHGLRKFQENFGRVLNRSSLNFTSSIFVREELSRYFPGSRPALVTGLDVSRVSKNSFISASGNGESPAILMVGTLEPRKNYDLVLDWFKATSLKTELVIVGRRGWNTSKTVKKIRRMQRDGYRITWLGHASDKRLEEEYLRCQIGLCASQIEGFGLPLREFLARNRVTVASNIPAFSEIKDSRNIVYFDPKDLFSLELSIQKALGLEFNPQFKQDSSWTEITHTWMKEISNLLSDL